MKAIRFFLFFILLLTFYFGSYSQNISKEQFLIANKFYSEKKFPKAISEYNKLISDSYKSDEIYYNLGNAYFRNNEPAKAIWCYEKSLLLNASNSDAKNNLDFVKRNTIGVQEVLPENFLQSMWIYIYSLMSWKNWAFSFLVLLALFMFSLMVFLLSASYTKRKLFFTISFVILGLLIVSLTQSIIGNYNIKHSKSAIVISDPIQLKSAPDSTGTAIAIIQPGIKVNIKENKNPWLKIVTPDGTQGWLTDKGVLRLNANTPE